MWLTHLDSNAEISLAFLFSALTHLCNISLQEIRCSQWYSIFHMWEMLLFWYNRTVTFNLVRKVTVTPEDSEKWLSSRTMTLWHDMIYFFHNLLFSSSSSSISHETNTFTWSRLLKIHFHPFKKTGLIIRAVRRVQMLWRMSSAVQSSNVLGEKDFFFEAMAEATQVFVGTSAMRVWRGGLRCRGARLFEMEVLLHFVHRWWDQHNTTGATVDCTSLTMVNCKVVFMIAPKGNNSFLPFLSSRVYGGNPNPEDAEPLWPARCLSHTDILSLSPFFSRPCWFWLGWS